MHINNSVTNMKPGPTLLATTQFGELLDVMSQKSLNLERRVSAYMQSRVNISYISEV